MDYPVPVFSTNELPMSLYVCLLSVQVYSQLPVQKLSGYHYEVEDSEPYPCFSVPEPVPEVEARPEAAVEPEMEIEVDAQVAGRSKRSIYFGPPPMKNDVYSIFKVEPFDWLLKSRQQEMICLSVFILCSSKDQVILCVTS